MSAAKFPVTLAIRALRAANIQFEPHVYMWEAHSAATIYINGGARGFLVAIDPHDAQRVLAPTLVDVAIEK